MQVCSSYLRELKRFPQTGGVMSLPPIPPLINYYDGE